jgi:alpha-glucosidase
MDAPVPWWKTAVFYQIYPRSFCDTDGDGVGDLEGIRRHLDHVRDLGVDAVWISPFFRSPMRDFGYDVSDYCDVDPLFGTLADFDRLLADCHERGLRVMIDWVPNHSSDLHPWFLASRSSREDPKRAWYVWRDGSPDEPPNNWKAAFSDGRDPAWTWDEATSQWYLHAFLPQQPDLNWQHPEVVEAMHGTLRFWLDRGVDGFRMDVVHLIGKDPALPDLAAGEDLVTATDEPHTHELLRGIRAVLDGYDGDRTSVGEVYLMDPERVATYYGADDELHLSFNFPPLWAPWDAEAWLAGIELVEQHFTPRDAWPTWVLSNHDVPRHRTRYGSEARARAAAVLLLTLRGTPFVYAGEELGLTDAEVPPEREVDPGGRDGCRAPIPWTAGEGHGWASPEPWLPWPPEAGTRNPEVAGADPTSVLALYRRLLAARRASPALQLGAWRPLQRAGDGDGVLAYERVADDDRRVVVVSFVSEPRRVAVPGDWVVEVASDCAGEGVGYSGEVAGDQAVLLRPAGAAG